MQPSMMVVVALRQPGDPDTLHYAHYWSLRFALKPAAQCHLPLRDRVLIAVCSHHDANTPGTAARRPKKQLRLTVPEGHDFGPHRRHPEAGVLAPVYRQRAG